MIPINDLSRSQDFDEYFFRDLKDLLNSGIYLNGVYTLKLESLISQCSKKDFAFGVSSGTAALTLALRAAKLEKGSFVMLAANAGGYARIAVENSGLQPWYADVDANGLLNAETCAEALKKSDMLGFEISALVVTHLYGQLADLESIRDCFSNKNVIYIEDCAQSFGATLPESPVGSVGDISTFSFYPTKNLGGIGDSGALATSNPIFAERIASLRQYGWESKYSVTEKFGDNLRIDEIQALTLIHRLPLLQEKNLRRRLIWQEYYNSLKDSRLRILGRNDETFVAHLAILDCSSSRDYVRNRLEENGIMTAIHYPIPDHRQLAWFDESISLPETERQARAFLSIPIFPEMYLDEIVQITSVLEAIGEIN